jgi:hypothetical protein
MTCEGVGASSAWYWHEAGMAAVFSNVRSWGKADIEPTGRHFRL